MRGKILMAGLVGVCFAGGALAHPKPGTYTAPKARPALMGPSNPEGGPWNDNFDSYTLGLLVNQGGWQHWSGSINPDGYVVNTQAASGTQSMRMTAAQPSSTDMVQTYTVVGGRWRFAGKAYVPSTTTGNGYFILLNTYPAFDWSVQILFNADTNAVSILPAHAGQVGNTLTLVEDQWVQFVVEIDLSAATPVWSATYNGQVLATGQTWDDLGNNQLQALDCYSETIQDMFYDDLVLTCYADCNLSGSKTIADFACFQAAFAGNNPYADCNGSGTLTIADFGCFQAAFAASCP